MLLLVFAVSLGIVALAALVQATRCPSPPSSVPPSTVVIIQLQVYCTFVASDLPGRGRGDGTQGQERDDERDAEQAEEAEYYHVPVQETQQ